MEQRAKALTDTQSHPPTCTPTLPEVPERTRLWGGQNLGFHLPAHTYKGRPSVRGEARLHTRRAAQKRVHGFIRKNTFLIAPRTRRAHVPAPAHSRTYTHPSVRPHVHHTQTHTETHTDIHARGQLDTHPCEPPNTLRALTRLAALLWRLAGRRAHTQTHTHGPRTAPRPWPRPGLCAARLAGGDRGGGGGGGQRAEEAEQGAGSRLARAPPAGRGFSSLGADAADLPAAASDHGRQRDTVSAGGGPAGCVWGDLGEGTGRGSSPHSGSAFAVTPAPGSAASSSPLPQRFSVWSLLEPWAGYRETRTGCPIWLLARWRQIHTHTRSLADTQRWPADAEMHGGWGGGRQVDTQWHTHSCGHTGTLIHSSMGMLMLARTLTFIATYSSHTVTHTYWYTLFNIFLLTVMWAYTGHTPTHINSNTPSCWHTHVVYSDTHTLSLPLAVIVTDAHTLSHLLTVNTCAGTYLTNTLFARSHQR